MKTCELIQNSAAVWRLCAVTLHKGYTNKV